VWWKVLHWFVVKNLIHFPTVKNFEDRLTFDKDRTKIKVARFMAQGVYLRMCLGRRGYTCDNSRQRQQQSQLHVVSISVSR